MKRKDEELVKRALRGDNDAFGALVQKYQGVVYGLCYHLISDFAEAQDLSQDAFLQAYLKLAELKNPAKFAGWLRTIATNLCMTWLRRKKDIISFEQLTDDELDPNAVSTPEEELERKELSARIMQTIDQLPEQSRLVITLYYIDGLSYREIASFLDVPQGTVMSRLHRARAKLKKEMMEMVEQNKLETLGLSHTRAPERLH